MKFSTNTIHSLCIQGSSGQSLLTDRPYKQASVKLTSELLVVTLAKIVIVATSLAYSLAKSFY